MFRRIILKNALIPQSKQKYVWFSSISMDDPGGNLKNKTSFRDNYKKRKDEASRSILIQIPGKNSCNSIYKLCEEFGSVKKAFFNAHVKNYILLEYAKKQSVKNLLESATHFQDIGGIPCTSRVLIYSGNGFFKRDSSVTAPVWFEGPRGVDMLQLQQANSVSEQLQIFYASERQTELEIRLRYFLCSLVEDHVLHLVPSVEVQPFGSSANGLGRHSSDLDMTLSVLRPKAPDKTKSDLRFLTKVYGEQRFYAQKLLGAISMSLEVFAPHFERMQQILHAKIPILHFFHSSTYISCDMSFNNKSGLLMSMILYILGEHSSKFRPLVFILRRWAAVNELTIEQPGPVFSNFMLTCMLIHFLQNRSQPVLPPFRSIISGNSRIMGYATDLQVKENLELPLSNNKEKIGGLLLEFFRFYADFDYNSRGLSILTGKFLNNTSSSRMFIQNPLDLSHNVTQNVDEKQLNELKQCLQDSVVILENAKTKSVKSWGIMPLLECKTKEYLERELITS